VKKGLSANVTMTAIVAVLLAAAARPVFAQARDAEAQDRRRNIRYMEGVLVQAVRVGAEMVGKELERYEPTGVTMLMGSPRARGFVLEGHGIFFDVEVPEINQSVVWSVMIAQRDRQISNAIDSLRSVMRGMPNDAAQQAESALQLLNAAVGPAPTRDVAAASKDTSPVMKDVPVGRVSPQPAVIEPRKIYHAAVIGSVVDAMLGYSVQMALGADEWLTVAARGYDGPSGPQQGLSETTTITVRVKGSDLAIYHADPTRRAEIREKVKADARVF
jgi:hypothetical protein